MLAVQPRPEPHRIAALVSAQWRSARHRPEQTLLYQIVEQYAEAFFTYLSERDATLPGFVRGEFEANLRRGRRLNELVMRAVLYLDAMDF